MMAISVLIGLGLLGTAIILCGVGKLCVYNENAIMACAVLVVTLIAGFVGIRCCIAGLDGLYALV